MRPHQPVVVSIGRAFGITGLFLAIQLGITIAIGAFLGVKAVFDDAPLGDLSDLMTADLPVMLLVANSLAAFAVVSIELRRQKLPWLFNRAGSVSAAWLLPPVVLAAVGNAFIAGVVLHGLIQVFPSLGELPPMFQGLFDLARHPVIVPLTLVVVAPVTEETIFRALILGGLLRTRRPRTAILISAALFSGMHLNLGQVPATFLIGLVYGWIFYRTRSLSLCILAHALHNGLALLVTAHELSQFDPVLVEDTVPWLALLATGAVLLTAGLVWIARITPRPVFTIPPPLPPPPPARKIPLPSAPQFAPIPPPMPDELAQQVTALAQRARAASYVLATTPTAQKDAALLKLAELLPAAAERLMAANQLDLAAAADNGLSAAEIDRLTLTPARLEHLAQSVREVAALPDPVGAALETTTRPNGLVIEKRRVPIGVIGIIYEARPNVTIDCAILCLKSGNAAILRGGKEIFNTNTAFAALIAEALAAAGLPADAVQLIPTTDRAALNTLLKLDELIHCIIPRGGEGLIRFVAQNSTIPVIKHYTGVCCVYLDEHADADIAERVTVNAKTQRPGVCNAAEQLLVHAAVAATLLPQVARALTTAGVELRVDERAAALLAAADIAHTPAAPTDFKEEFLGLIMAVRIVDSLDDAIAQINRDSSGHSESIITTDAAAAARFQAAVDSSAVFWNASTRFNDGFEFGFGAEIGISTDRLHARGPMGLPELCSYKYVVTGTGQTRG